MVVLSPLQGRAHRRVLFVNSYGGADVWRKVKDGLLPPHHLWGCLELVRMGYEVALAEAMPDFYFYRNPIPHDAALLNMILSWLGSDGLIYCGHNVLYWLPLLRRLRALRAKVVSLLFAREPLNQAAGHDAVIALTPSAAEHARQLAPAAKVAHLGWGADLEAFPRYEFNPRWALSCGIANRDFGTLCEATKQIDVPVRVVCPGIQPGLVWPKNAEVIDGGPGWNADDKKLLFQDLLRDHYSSALASLIVLNRDDREHTANGFTNQLEAMAMSRPVIMTKTGAMPSEFDIEKTGCGIYVPPEDPQALAEAIQELAVDPARAKAMGEAGRKLCESHYNIGRYARDLHGLFENL